MKSKFRVVEGGKKPSIFADLEALRIPPDEEPAKVSARSRKVKGRWTPVAVDWLMDRHWDRYLPAVTRLYLWLAYNSLRGRKPVAFTPRLTAKIGIGKQHRYRCLQQLESDGLITIDRSDPTLPTVTVKPHPAGLW